MALFTIPHLQYYENQYSVTVTAANNIASTRAITLPFDPKVTNVLDLTVFLNGSEVNVSNYDATPYNSGTGVLTFDATGGTWTQPALHDVILVKQNAFSESLGNYQFISLDDIVNNFIISYVGENKIIPKVRRADIAFHAQRAIQELSYDTFRSAKSQEIDLPPSLTMSLPHDYVNYVKLSFTDNSGIQRLILPARKTGNPTAILQNADYEYLYDANGDLLLSSDSETWTKFKDTSGGNTDDSDTDDIDEVFFEGRRFGIEPEHSGQNGVFFIDNSRGVIYFSSNLSGKTITLQYISDGVGTDAEKIVHKFAEEAMYKWIAHAILATRINTPEYLVARFKKERFAEIRKAKLRLSNLKLEELTQVMRGKSKQIKH